MNKIMLGLIGAGNIANAHVAAAADSDGRVAFGAVIDPNEQARTTLAEKLGVPAYAQLADLVVDQAVASSLQGLVVCTPPSTRLDITKLALHEGLPLLMEKPLAHTLADAQAIAAEVHAHPNTPVAFGYCHRYTPAVQAMVDAMAAGKIGQPVRFENVFAAYLPHLRESWMSDPVVSGGGSLIDTGCHSVDLFQYLCGPAQFESAVMHHTWPGRGESNASLTLSAVPPVGSVPSTSTSVPVAGMIGSGWAEPTRFHVKIVGTEGSLFYDFEVPETLVFTSIAGDVVNETVETHEVRFTRQLQAFADLIESPEMETKLCRIEEALSVSQLIDQAFQQGKAQQLALNTHVVQSEPAKPVGASTSSTS